MSIWSFGGIPFRWGRVSSPAGLAASPTWLTPPRLVIRPLLGLSLPDVADVGDEPTTISGAIVVASEHAAALRTLNGTRGTLRNGSSSWTAVLALKDFVDLLDGDASGSATFTRVGA